MYQQSELQLFEIQFCACVTSTREGVLTLVFFVILGRAEVSSSSFFYWIRRVEDKNSSNGRSGTTGDGIYIRGDIEEKEESIALTRKSQLELGQHGGKKRKVEDIKRPEQLVREFREGELDLIRMKQRTKRAKSALSTPNSKPFICHSSTWQK
ncbi:hypothetical protein OIU77_026645 [Salix suchowensis]|uniref:Uncharacterized protein n=1 Tax=Salix suchowensis TaxID=1278906 RepID=A0ABQ9BQ27_9ROSI|nr:hypothetical protein OIU77_026645 [Salix suchowensis]